MNKNVAVRILKGRSPATWWLFHIRLQSVHTCVCVCGQQDNISLAQSHIIYQCTTWEWDHGLASQHISLIRRCTTTTSCNLEQLLFRGELAAKLFVEDWYNLADFSWCWDLVLKTVWYAETDSLEGGKEKYKVVWLSASISTLCSWLHDCQLDITFCFAVTRLATAIVLEL